MVKITKVKGRVRFPTRGPEIKRAEQARRKLAKKLLKEREARKKAQRKAFKKGLKKTGSVLAKAFGGAIKTGSRIKIKRGRVKTKVIKISSPQRRELSRLRREIIERRQRARQAFFTPSEEFEEKKRELREKISFLKRGRL